MTDRIVPSLTKWPFLLGDLILLGVAAGAAISQPYPLTTAPLLLVAACVAVGAGLAVWPFVLDHRAALRLAEANQLATTVAQLEQLRTVGEQVRLATAQWQAVQEHATRAVDAAREITERMSAEARAFAEFMQKANDNERSRLRLELEKLRRNEGEWLQTLIRILDHVYALALAANRSGQPALREQLGKFRGACYDAARRIGLVPIEARPGEPFRTEHHQLPHAKETPPTGAVIQETLATGYTYQSEVLRLPVVTVVSPTATAPPPRNVGAEPPVTAEPSTVEAGRVSPQEKRHAPGTDAFRLES
ncbi:MAG TPA: nucleotide exchange factor GrpE [Methylomirabilota bacterium]|nr:nucleotide exchange factor GrpE [Methylomirabilota bacterium]